MHQENKLWSYLQDHEYLLLICFTLLTLVAYPFLEWHSHGAVWYHILLSLILLAGVSSSGDKWQLIWSIVLVGLLSFGLSWADFLVGSEEWILLLYLIVTLVFFVLVLTKVLYSIFGHTKVNKHLIFGSIAGYLMIGMAGAFAFAVIELSYPGSFAPAVTTIGNIPSFLYYSFVSMLTIGYGDMVPVGGQAQMRSVLFAIAGQLYLTIIVWVLIGKYVRDK